MTYPAQTGAIEPGTLVGGLLVAVIGVWTLRIAVRSVGRLASMVGTSTRPVEAVEPGTVEVEGTVRSAGKTVSGEVTESKAVVTEYRSQTYDRSDENNLGLLPIPQSLTPNALNKTAAVPFYVDDDTGRVLVDPVKADVSLSTETKERERLGADRRKHEVEALLEPGDEVYVLGRAVPSERYSPPERSGILYKLYRLLGGDYKQIPASDVIDDEDLVITRDGERTKFVISDTAEWRGWIRQVLMALLWTALAIALVVIGAYLALTGAGMSSLLPV